MLISTRLKIAAAIPAVIAAMTAAVVGYISIVNKDMRERQTEASAIYRKVTELNTLARAYARQHEERPIHQYRLVTNQVSNLLIAASFRMPSDRGYLIEISKDTDAMSRILSKLISNFQHHLANPNDDLLKEAEQLLLGQLWVRSSEARTDAEELLASVQKQNWQEQRRIDNVTLAIVLAGGGLIVAMLLTLRRSILTRLDELGKGVETIRQGNLDHRIGPFRPDELGHLAEAFNSMTAGLKQTTVSRNLLAQEVEERRRFEQALRVSEEKFKNVFRTSESSISITTIDGKYVDVNDAFIEFTGFTREQVVGNSLRQLGIWEDVGARDRIVQRLGNGERVRNVEVALRTKFRGRRTTLLSAALMDIDNERCVVASANDITDRKQAEEALSRLNETLEKRVAERTKLAEARSRQLQALAVELVESEERERRRFAELLHDDLQQMLAAARLQLQGAYEGTPPGPLATVERLLEEAIKKSRRLSHELSPAIIYHSGLIAGLKWLCQQMKLRFDMEVNLRDSVQPTLMSEPVSLFVFRAVQELLFNVVKHAGVKAADVEVSRKDTYLAVSVSDKGKGFDPKNLNPSLENRPGLGLLSLRERAGYLGGCIDVESSLGQGSRFTVLVPEETAPPLHSDEPEPQKRRVEEADKDASQAGSTAIRVLLVDDHTVMRQGLRTLLSSQPQIHIVGEATNGREAVVGAEELKPDTVLMDISMPEMDGIAATRVIKSKLPSVRIIGLSMHEDQALIENMLNSGADLCMSKAVSSAELLKAIFGGHRVTKEGSTLHS